MSRIGKAPVQIPKGVKVAVNAGSLTVEGPLGKLEHRVHPAVAVAMDPGCFGTDGNAVGRQSGGAEPAWPDARPGRQHGRGCFARVMRRKLEIVGVGYLAAIQKNVLQLRVGFANELQVPIPAGLTVTCPDQTHISVKGIDKQLVGQFAASVRALRKPEPYKGKGIRYEAEQVRRKAGKAVTK